MEDITEWKKIQLTLTESERRFRDRAENVPGVLYEWHQHRDGTYRFNYVSPKISELFGVQPADIDRVLDFFHPDDMGPVRASIEHASRTQTPWLYEGRVLVPG